MADKKQSVVYVGPHWAVELNCPDGSIGFVERGGTLETTPEHAEALLLQTVNWQSPRTAAARSAKAEKEEVE